MAKNIIDTAREAGFERLVAAIDAAIHVNGPQILSADIEASNGVLQAIDRVLLPAAI